jgi:hypothetical protein
MIQTQTACMSTFNIRPVVAVAVLMILATSCSQNMAEKALKKAASLGRSASMAHSTTLDKEDINCGSSHVENSGTSSLSNDTYDRLPMAAY